MAVKAAEIRVKIESDTKAKAQRILKKVGMTESEAVRIFFRNLVSRKEFPLELKVPNEETVNAIYDARSKRNLSKAYTNVDEMFEDLSK